MDEEISQHSGADADSEFTSAIYGEMAKSPRSVISEEDTVHGGGATGDSGSTATTSGAAASSLSTTDPPMLATLSIPLANVRVFHFHASSSALILLSLSLLF